jgi:hypothetical protein
LTDSQEYLLIGEVTAMIQWIVNDFHIYNDYPHDFILHATRAFCNPYLKELNLMLNEIK